MDYNPLNEIKSMSLIDINEQIIGREDLFFIIPTNNA